MRFAFTASLALFTCACSTAPPGSKEAPLKIASAPPDQSPHFPTAALTKMDLVPNHLLGKAFMPGGNIATYRSGKLQYQEFLAKLPDAQTAAFLLLDWKKALQQPRYLAHMGGFYGNDGALPIYVFVKGTWIAGVTGLPETEADPIARELAARI